MMNKQKTPCDGCHTGLRGLGRGGSIVRFDLSPHRRELPGGGDALGNFRGLYAISEVLNSNDLPMSLSIARRGDTNLNIVVQAIQEPHQLIDAVIGKFRVFEPRNFG